MLNNSPIGQEKYVRTCFHPRICDSVNREKNNGNCFGLGSVDGHYAVCSGDDGDKMVKLYQSLVIFFPPAYTHVAENYER